MLHVHRECGWKEEISIRGHGCRFAVLAREPWDFTRKRDLEVLGLWEELWKRGLSETPGKDRGLSSPREGWWYGKAEAGKSRVLAQEVKHLASLSRAPLNQYFKILFT